MQSLFLRYASAPLIAGVCMALIIALMLVVVGAFSPPELPSGFTSKRQLLGIDMLLVLMPSYLVVAWGLSLRRSRVLLGDVDALIGSPTYADSVRTPVRFMLTGIGIGVAYAVSFNLPIASVRDLIAGGSLLICLVALMILVWVTVGMTLASRLYIASLFHRAGRQVPVDSYELSPLEPFARSGMGDVVLVIGALVLATVQSIDATFRSQNYLFSTIVAVPAGLALLMLPMYSLHRRLMDLKKRELADVKVMIRDCSKSLALANVAALESLLQRRDRIESLHTWPLNVSMVSRLLIYGVIPPAAWIGAALMEHFVDQLLGG
jgi:hypothetical protein